MLSATERGTLCHRVREKTVVVWRIIYAMNVGCLYFFFVFLGYVKQTQG